MPLVFLLIAFQLLAVVWSEGNIGQAEIDAFYTWIEASNEKSADTKIFLREKLESDSSGLVGYIVPYIKADVKKDELLWSVPLKLGLDSQLDTFYQEELLAKVGDYHSDQWAIVKIAEELAKSNSFWQPLFDILPTTRLRRTAAFWEEDEVEELKGGSWWKPVNRHVSTVIQLHANLFDASFMPDAKTSTHASLFELYPQHFVDRDAFSLDSLRLAYSIFHARKWNRGHFNSVLPLVDFFDFAKSSDTRFEITDSAILIYADKDLPAGSALTINDGLQANGLLMSLYGFVLKENPEDSYELSVGLDRDNKLYGYQRGLLEKAGLKDQQSYRITDTIPDSLITALRIYHLTVYDYDEGKKAADNQQVSLQNEKKVWTSIGQLATGVIEGYSTTSKEDSALLKKKLPPIKKMAVFVRRSEKKMMRAARRMAEARLEMIKSRWNFREFDTPEDGGIRISNPKQNEHQEL